MSAYVVDKEHIDMLVQTALAGTTDAASWLYPSDHFTWHYDGRTRYLDSRAEVGDERRAAMEGFQSIELVTPSQLGQILTNECVRSVSYRYPNDDIDAGELPGPCDAYYLMPYVFQAHSSISTAAAAKLIDCYSYQSCEHPEWRESHAYAFCQALRGYLLSHLPGYDAAPWGVS